MAKYEDLRPIPDLTSKQLLNFYNKIKVEGKGCWNWIAGKNHDGHGIFYLPNAMFLASRVSYKIHYEEPGQLYVLHICDNPTCVNPKHLELGDQSANMLDRHHRNGFSHRGEDHPQSKFTTSDIIEIHQLNSDGVSVKDIAKRMNVTISPIYQILSGKSYTHVKI